MEITTAQATAFALLGGALVVFAIDRWRYDVVALLTLLGGVLTGIVPTADAFKGFSEPVVTTVACVLVISATLRHTGALNRAIGWLAPLLERPNLQVGVLVALVITLSAFMNNVGALALVLPVAIQLARKAGRSPSEFLMPLAFGSLLGGLITLIGTPPNLLISDARRNFVGEPYAMFDFTPVGLSIALAGLGFLSFGWRLLPRDRRGQPLPEEKFSIQDYVTETRVTEASKAVGHTIAELEAGADGDATVVGIIRAGHRRLAPAGTASIEAGDVLILETNPATLQRLIDANGLELVPNKALDLEPSTTDEIGIAEAVVMAGSELIGRTPINLALRQRFRVNLLAVRRAGGPPRRRLSAIRLAAGDVIVLQGSLESMTEVLAQLGCLPLAERNLQLGRPRRALVASAILAAAVTVNALGVLPIAIALLSAVAVIALARLVTLKEIYAAIDWPILVMLGALIPVTDAVERTGGSALVAERIAALAQGLPGAGVVALVLVATMLVTPVLNNAATVLLMAPIAANIAKALGLSLDPLLMAVAIGASCDFLTPIGHQSNTLVMGPGGYRFSDYWRLGLPVTLLVLIIGVPLILFFWPLG